MYSLLIVTVFVLSLEACSLVLLLNLQLDNNYGMQRNNGVGMYVPAFCHVLGATIHSWFTSSLLKLAASTESAPRSEASGPNWVVRYPS